MGLAELGIDSQNVVNFVCNVGDRVKICPPASYLPAWTGTPDGQDERYFREGFTILDINLGHFDETVGACVYYNHDNSGQQVIRYSSRDLGEMDFYLVMEGITVHDHASIPQGGPAFATYWAEVPENQEEES